MTDVSYIGIDLAGSDLRETITCVLIKNTLTFFSLYTDDQIIDFVQSYKPRIIAIDAPLQLPKVGWFRECDILMKKMGLKPLPPMWKSMKKLTLRAIALKRKLKKFRIIETFPTGFLNVLRIKNIKKVDVQHRVFGFILKTIKLKILNKTLFKKDVLDALIAAIAAYYYDNKIENCLLIKDEDCLIVIPKIL